jgi:hypothetical protein
MILVPLSTHEMPSRHSRGFTAGRPPSSPGGAQGNRSSMISHCPSVNSNVDSVLDPDSTTSSWWPWDRVVMSASFRRTTRRNSRSNRLTQIRFTDHFQASRIPSLAFSRRQKLWRFNACLIANVETHPQTRKVLHLRARTSPLLPVAHSPASRNTVSSRRCQRQSVCSTICESMGSFQEVIRCRAPAELGPSYKLGSLHDCKTRQLRKNYRPRQSPAKPCKVNENTTSVSITFESQA